MGEGSLHLSSDNLEYYIVTLFEKIEAIRNENVETSPKFWKVPVKTELRSLEFWRSVICECIASFCYVFIVCGAAAGAGAGATTASILFATALAAGLSMTTLTQCFGHISGAHINPAVTLAMVITKRLTFVRSTMFIIAQCGGGIAGAAFIYGMTMPGYQSNLSAALMQAGTIVAWERFGVELILSFIVVLTYLITMDKYTKWLGSSSLTIGAAYAACTFVSMPYLNPARSLGPSFVLNKWENHWIYWIGPLAGGLVSGLVYEYVLNTRRTKTSKDLIDGDSSSIQSDEDAYDDFEKPSNKYNDYRPPGNIVVTSGSSYCPSLMSASLYSAPLCKLERVESLYGGTKSLYCKSPPLTRANLNRSQSVYAKSNHSSNRDALPRPGPLIPAQSLYPMRLNQQQSHLQNQNVQNQLQQRSECNFVGRTTTTSGATRSDVYGTMGSNTRNITEGADVVKYEDTPRIARSNRPESMYGMPTNHSRHAQSDDSTYGSYYGSSKRPTVNTSLSYHTSSTNTPPKNSTINNKYGTRTTEVKHSPLQLIPTPSTSSSFHHMLPQHSPKPQY